MAILKINGDTSGSVSLTVPAVAGTNTATVPAQTGTLSMLAQATSVTASGTSVDFTAIPAWAKRIYIVYSGLTTSSAVSPRIQAIVSSTPVTSGYAGTVWYHNTTAISASATLASAFELLNSWSGSTAYYGSVTLTNITSNTWLCNGTSGSLGGLGGGTDGSNALSGVLNGVRLTIDGSATFTAGTVNILYEG